MGLRNPTDQGEFDAPLNRRRNRPPENKDKSLTINGNVTKNVSPKIFDEKPTNTSVARILIVGGVDSADSSIVAQSFIAAESVSPHCLAFDLQLQLLCEHVRDID